MTYEIRIRESARSDLDELNRSESIRDAIREVAECRNPEEHRNVIQLRALEGESLYRLRVGVYRVVFGVVSPTLFVFDVRHRNADGYRNLEAHQRTLNQLHAES